MIDPTNHPVTGQLNLPDIEMSRLHSIIDTAPAAIGVFVGRDLVIQHPNRAFIEIVGKGWDVVGKPLREAMPELLSEGQPYLDILDKVFTTGKMFKTDGSLVRIVQNGVLTDRYYNFTYSPLFDESGNVWAILDIAIDVTEQVELRKKVEEREHHFRQLTDSLPAIIWITQADGRCIYLNDLWFEFTGQTEEEARDYGWLDAIHPEDKLEAITMFNEANASQKPFTLLYRLRTKSGEYRWAIEKGTPKFSRDGVYEGMIGTVLDVHEQRVAQEKLRHQEERLRGLIEQAPVATCLFVGREMVIELANQPMLDYWGRDKGVIGTKLADALPELQGQPFLDFLDKVYTTGEPFIGHAYPAVLENNGELKRSYFDFTYKAVRNDRGEVYGVMNMAIDVTPQVEAARKIAESEATLNELANAMPQLVWIADANGAVTYYNDRLLEFAGVSRNADGAWMWGGLVYEEDADLTAEAWETALATRTPYNTQHRLKMKDGSLRWFLSRAVPQKDRNGKVLKWFGTATDIHEQKVIEQKIRESEERFRTLAISIPQIVWSCDVEGNVDYLNDQWEVYTGQRVEDALPNTSDLLHPEDRYVMDTEWKKAVEFGHEWKADYRLKNVLTGEYRWFTGVTIPVRNQHGEIVRWIGTATDIHEQKQFAEKLERIVNERTRELQQSNSDLQQFAHVASHDLKEPVRKIKTYVDRLHLESGQVLGEKGSTYLQKVNNATERMMAMIDGVLNYSTLTSAAQRYECVDLNQVIRSIETDLELLIEQRGAVIDFDNLPTIEGAPVLLYQLFYNLINNSIKFSRPGVPTRIQIKSEVYDGLIGKRVKIFFKDNGIGFDQEYADAIFRSFTRLHSRDRYEGTGLGLALCRKIAERHGGTIEASGMPDLGATFIIDLPLE